MIIQSRLLVLFIAALMTACSDDDNPAGGGTPDTTPPGVAAVTPVDAFHIDVTFSEEVTKSSAEDAGNYTITEAATPAPTAQNAGPGDPMGIAGLTLENDRKTVTITTESSMAGLNFDLAVDDVSDTHGNAIGTPVQRTFTGSNTPDTTPPQIVNFSPAANETNVHVGVPVTVQFSEVVDLASVIDGADWSSPAGALFFNVQREGTTITLSPDEPLDNGALHTVTLAGVRDIAGNTMPDAEWSFTTTTVVDNIPPTLVSTTPADNATNVSLNATLSMTFSEAVNQEEFNVALVPDPGDGVVTWSNIGRTVTFDPEFPLVDNTQYTLVIYPGGVVDLSGNGIVGLHTVTFTTAGVLESGTITGIITGDPGTQAASAVGATVIAATGSPILGEEFDIAGTTTVTENSTYALSQLPDDVYYPLAILDTNGDGTFDPGFGDAVGAYGITFPGDMVPDSVEIAGGIERGEVDFALFDPSAVLGSVTYSGIHAEGNWAVFVGLFDTTDFLPTDEPVTGTIASWPGNRYWVFNSFDFDFGFPDDQYYVGAFIDVNENGNYDPATDPAGLYGGLISPTPLDVFNGLDFLDIVIPVADPAPGATGAAITWPVSKHKARFPRLCDAVRRIQAQAQK